MKVNQVSYLQNNRQAQSFTSSMPVGNLERGLERIRLKNDAAENPGKLRSIIGNTGFLGGFLVALCGAIVGLGQKASNMQISDNVIYACFGGLTLMFLSAAILDNRIINFFKRK